MLDAKRKAYQECRVSAGLSAVQACQELHISLRTLSAYENGERKPNDEIVENMVKVYKAPMLAWWYLKTQTPWGQYLPDIAQPKSSNDMAFQSILMEEDLIKANQIIKKVLRDGVVTADEKHLMDEYRKLIDDATDKGASITAFKELSSI